MRDRSNEIVEMLSRRQIFICCEQESRWRGESARKIFKFFKFKFFWRRDNYASESIAVLVANEWIEKVILIVRHSIRLMMLQLLCRKSIVTLLNQVTLPMRDLSHRRSFKLC